MSGTSDFVHSDSSEEEKSIGTKVLEYSPSSRHSPALRAGEDERQHASNIYGTHYNAITYHTQNGHLRIPMPTIDVQPSPANSQSHRSISRKSLREIPKDDVRLSQVIILVLAIFECHLR